jgi:hypothetical protein
MLDYYRKLYKLIKKSSVNNKEERLAEIVKAVELWKLNPTFGSKEVNGNGVCYECHLKLAREGHYNCEECAGVQLNGKIRRTIPEIQKILEQWSKRITWEDEVEMVFK